MASPRAAAASPRAAGAHGGRLIAGPFDPVGVAVEGPDRVPALYGQTVNWSASERPVVKGACGSRYQYWQWIVSPTSMPFEVM